MHVNKSQQAGCKPVSLVNLAIAGTVICCHRTLLFINKKGSNAHRSANQLYVKLLSSVLQGAEVHAPVVEVCILLQLHKTPAHVRWAKR